MKPIVGIIVGSDSDLPLIQETANVLDELNVLYEVTIGSAHRTPELVSEYVSTANERGICVIIAAAGGAAHLPGVIASKTNLPVIGIPVDNSPLNGIDALYSIVQMPGGIPVASMAIGKAGAMNAGIFSAQILALMDSELAQRLVKFRKKMAESVKSKADKLAEVGLNKYLEGKKT
ncbi:MAG: 5-(carboxyamino)imidazole ribonucleotide mutase [Candidatus Poribacteria bacterium]|nr:5-(carboxyamino)imidazole ribonucleotide mutase [Candidatus Poribacteria bacterium]